MKIIEFVIASMVLTVMPGPDIVFVLVQGLTRGKKAGMAVSLGLCTGLIAHTTAAALGLSLLITGSPVAFGVIKYTGVLYLAYMGLKSFLGRKREGMLADGGECAGERLTFARLYKRGIMMNLLNPKVIVFFLALFPQFIDAGSATYKTDVFILGGLFAAQALAIFSAVSLLAGVISGKFAVNRLSNKVVGIINAVVYWAIAVVFLFAGMSQS